MLRCKKLANTIHKGISISTRKRERERDTIFKKSIHIFNISISFLPETIIITMITIMSSKRENSNSKVSRFKTWIFFFFNHESISRVFFSSRRKNSNRSTGGSLKKEKRNNGRNGGVGNHRCIGNCTLPVHDSFITHEFITSRLARNRYQLGKRFRRKAIATVRKNTIVAGIIHSGRRKNRINYYPFVHFFPCRKCIEKSSYLLVENR